MVNAKKLKSLFVENDLTQEEVAKALGISSRTLSTRLSRGIFFSDEIEKLIALLSIEDPVSVFFASKVTSKDT